MYKDFAETESMFLKVSMHKKKKDFEDFMDNYNKYWEEVVEDDTSVLRNETIESKLVNLKHRFKVWMAVAASFFIAVLSWLAPHVSPSLRLANLVAYADYEKQKNELATVKNEFVELEEEKNNEISQKEKKIAEYQEEMNELNAIVDSIKSIKPTQFIANNIDVKKFIPKHSFCEIFDLKKALSPYAAIMSEDKNSFLPFECFKNDSMIPKSKFDIYNNTKNKYEVNIYTNEGNLFYNYSFEPGFKDTIKFYCEGLYGLRIYIYDDNDIEINRTDRIIYITEIK
jgi:hypothetical protein